MRFTWPLFAILLLSGCRMTPFHRAKAPPPPPGPTPVRIPDQVTSMEPAPPPKNLPQPPVIPTPQPDAKASEAAELAIPKAPTGRPPKVPKPKRVAKKPAPPPAPPAPVEESVATTVAAPPPYRLGELRSPEEKDKLRRQGEQMLAVCTAALAAAEGRSLTVTQLEMAGRVRSFAQQAKETMEVDPVEARNLAAKGKTFAEALLAELK